MKILKKMTFITFLLLSQNMRAAAGDPQRRAGPSGRQDNSPIRDYSQMIGPSLQGPGVPSVKQQTLRTLNRLIQVQEELIYQLLTNRTANQAQIEDAVADLNSYLEEWELLNLV